VPTPKDSNCQTKRLEHALSNWANVPSEFDCKTIHEPENSIALILTMNSTHDYQKDFVTMTHRELEELTATSADGKIIKMSEE
jgi:hypothetical protein